MHLPDEDHPLPRLRPPLTIPDAMVLEAESPAHLLRLARDPKIGRYLLARVDDTTALVDVGAERALASALRAGGVPVKIVRIEP